MYKYIGKTVKILSFVYLGLGCLYAWLMAFGLFITGFNSHYDGEFYILAAMIVSVSGPVIFWLSSLFVYAFGELVDKTAFIATEIKKGKGNNDRANIAKIDIDPTEYQRIKQLKDKGLISDEEYAVVLAKYIKEA